MLNKIHENVELFPSLMRKALILLLTLSIMSLSQLSIAFAHGGEDHGDEAKTPIAAIGQMHTKLAKTDDLEVLVKYPTTKFGEETLLRVFVTDRKTNSPIASLNIAIRVSYVGKDLTAKAPSSSVALANTSTTEISTKPTDTPGIYEAHITFPDVGQYNFALQIAGQNINEQLAISGIVVPDKTSENPIGKNTYGIPILLITVVALLSIAAIGYFFSISDKSRQREVVITSNTTAQEQKA
ncbi:MAG: hypothetical protein AB1489_16245 [Acidobacteriota bacterium]